MSFKLLFYLIIYLIIILFNYLFNFTSGEGCIIKTLLKIEMYTLNNILNYIKCLLVRFININDYEN